MLFGRHNLADPPASGDGLAIGSVCDTGDWRQDN